MDVSSMTESLNKKINSELREKLSEIIDDYEIPVFSDTEEKDEEGLVAIFVSPDTSSKVSKKSKNVLLKLNIEFSTFSDFDVDKLRDESVCIFNIAYIWSILKAECVEKIRRDISSWSRQMFTALRKMFKESYDLDLIMVPFEIYIDNDDNVYISKLPKFEDLWFYDKKSPNNRLQHNLFLEEQAKSILSAANSDFFKKT